jgi:hypothetical protein
MDGSGRLCKGPQSDHALSAGAMVLGIMTRVTFGSGRALLADLVTVVLFGLMRGTSGSLGCRDRPGQSRKDRYVMLSPQLLGILRSY